MSSWSEYLILALAFGVPTVIEVRRRKQRRRAFRLSGVLKLRDRSIRMADVRELKAEAFRETTGFAIVIVLRDSTEIVIRDPVDEDLIAALNELGVDGNRIAAHMRGTREKPLVLWTSP